MRNEDNKKEHHLITSEGSDPRRKRKRTKTVNSAEIKTLAKISSSGKTRNRELE